MDGKNPTTCKKVLATRHSPMSLYFINIAQCYGFPCRCRRCHHCQA